MLPHCVGEHLALPTNIRLAQKNMPWENTLAYLTRNSTRVEHHMMPHCLGEHLAPPTIIRLDRNTWLGKTL
jgi:hypothetical protein